MKNINWNIDLTDWKKGATDRCFSKEIEKYYHAIESLKRIKQKFINGCNDDFDTDIQKDIDLAIAIINRFIPQKLTMIELTDNGLNGKGFYQVNCPNCGKKIGYIDPIFEFPIKRCNECGQAVKVEK